MEAKRGRAAVHSGTAALGRLTWANASGPARGTKTAARTLVAIVTSRFCQVAAAAPSVQFSAFCCPLLLAPQFAAAHSRGFHTAILPGLVPFRCDRPVRPYVRLFVCASASRAVMCPSVVISCGPAGLFQLLGGCRSPREERLLRSPPRSGAGSRGATLPPPDQGNEMLRFRQQDVEVRWLVGCTTGTKLRGKRAATLRKPQRAACSGRATRAMALRVVIAT